MKRENPLNLSILLRGGKETNKDSPLTASEAGRAQIGNRRALQHVELYPIDVTVSVEPGINLLKQGIIEGENPVFDPEFTAYDVRSQSRVAWECSANWVVKFI